MLMKRVATCPTGTATETPGPPSGLRPACHPEHRLSCLRQSARADSSSSRAGRPRTLAACAFTRYALQRPTPWGWVSGAPPPKAGHPAARPPERGYGVRAMPATSSPGCPAFVGVRALPPFSTVAWGRLFRVGAKFKNGSPVLLGVTSSSSGWTPSAPLCGPPAGLRPGNGNLLGHPSRGVPFGCFQHPNGVVFP